MPNIVSMLIEKPSRCMPAKVPMIDTGTARIGMTVARSDCRKTNTDQHDQHDRLEEGVHHFLDRDTA